MKLFALALTQVVVQVAFLFSAHQASAFPLTSRHHSVRIIATHGFNVQGIVALSNCSGSLVRFKSSKDTDLAMILTNGHCVSTGPFGGMLKPGQVLFNQDAQYDIELLDKNAQSLAELTTRRILYSTMTNTDVTLFELSTTYADIQRDTGVQALILNDQQTPVGVDIQIPSGYWKQTYACKTQAIIPELHESDWTFKNSILYSQPGCEIIGGTSGSPIVETQSGLVIGINNTSNEDGESCTLNNPCEIDKNGQKSVHKGAGYGQQTYLFYGCLGQTDRLDLNQASCVLPKP